MKFKATLEAELYITHELEDAFPGEKLHYVYTNETCRSLVGIIRENAEGDTFSVVGEDMEEQDLVTAVLQLFLKEMRGSVDVIHREVL